MKVTDTSIKERLESIFPDIRRLFGEFSVDFFDYSNEVDRYPSFRYTLSDPNHPESLEFMVSSVRNNPFYEVGVTIYSESEFSYGIWISAIPGKEESTFEDEEHFSVSFSKFPSQRVEKYVPILLEASGVVYPREERSAHDLAIALSEIRSLPE